MREIQMCPAEARTKTGAVHRLRFDATGRELVAWVEAKPAGPFGRLAGVTRGLYAHDLDADVVRPLLGRDWFDYWGDMSCEPVVSPDLRFVAAGIEFDRGETDGVVLLEDLRSPNERSFDLSVPPYGTGELMFTPDVAELIAVQNTTTDCEYAPDIVRFEMRAFTKPPTRFREEINPLTGQPYRAPVRTLRWKPVVSLPRGEGTCAASLSANGRLVVVGTENSTIHVADLKRKKVIASLPWEGRRLRYTAAVRVDLAPSADWVVMLASGRLFARPLGAGKAWRTKDTLGDIHDFAFHPDGRVLCAVFADGQARYFDPHTGAVRQSFKWAKKPKPLYSVAFAPDGLTCAAGGENGKVVVWDVDV